MEKIVELKAAREALYDAKNKLRICSKPTWFYDGKIDDIVRQLDDEIESLEGEK